MKYRLTIEGRNMAKLVALAQTIEKLDFDNVKPVECKCDKKVDVEAIEPMDTWRDAAEKPSMLAPKIDMGTNCPFCGKPDHPGFGCGGTKHGEVDEPEPEPEPEEPKGWASSIPIQPIMPHPFFVCPKCSKTNELHYGFEHATEMNARCMYCAKASNVIVINPAREDRDGEEG